MHYRSFVDLNRAIVSGLDKIPRDVDIVAGVPRSGLLAGTLLALHLNCPLTDLSGLIEGRVIDSGKTRVKEDARGLLHRKCKVIVIDDSVNLGNEIRAAKKRLKDAGLVHDIIYATVYATPEGSKEVDIALEILPTPRIFEWNLMHSHVLEMSCVDIDGVLCRDPLEEENDDGERYERFIRTAEPLFVPTCRIGWLVTCRLEKYRGLTEEWLRAYGIVYRELVMLDLPDKAARVASGSHASYKARVFDRSGATLFIESSQEQAARIAELTRRSVYCVSTGEMIAEPPLIQAVRLGKKGLRRAVFRISPGWLKSAYKKLRGALRGQKP